MSTPRPFAVFDIDGTLIRWQLYHAITDNLAKQGTLDQTTYQIVKDARRNWKQRLHHDSFHEYEAMLVEAYHKLLPQLTSKEFDAAINRTIAEYKEQVYTYTRELIKELKNEGYILFAISGSHHEAIAKIADHYGFDDFVGAQYIRKNSRFTGEKVLTVGRKHLILQELIKKHGVTTKKSYAVGDSTGDIKILEMVKNSIAFNPDRGLYDVAYKNGWKIVIERKNMIYELVASDGSYRLESPH